MTKRKLVFFIAAVMSSQFAIADICEHRPSKLIGAGLTGSVATGAGVTAAAGVGMKAAGYYAISHAASGAAMLGSTAAGTSAAGTVGIMGGTAGVVGTVGAFLMSPFVIIPAAVVAGGIGIYEGGCYLSSKK